MSAYAYLKKVYVDAQEERGCPQWRYKGPGLGQGLLHVIGLMEPHEVVTCCNTHGWLGTPEQFLKEFELLAA